jgi:hypothetical protein
LLNDKKRPKRLLHPFERALSVSVEQVEFELRFAPSISWLDFWLNPRRLRGSDFLMRWSKGVWSEERITQAVNEQPNFFALPYGPSGVAPDKSVREFELYFERLEEAGLGKMKRPDLLIFRRLDEAHINQIISDLGGVTELPFTRETDTRMQELLSHALVAVECENSLWKARQMPDYNSSLTPQKRLEGKPGLKKSAVLPTVIIKEEDRLPLLSWQTQSKIPIHVWQVFYDIAFGIALDEAERLVNERFILPKEQIFQAPGGATTKKIIYHFYHHYAYALGEASEEANLIAASITDKNGHILPYVKFEGGKMSLSTEALKVLTDAAEAKNYRI